MTAQFWRSLLAGSALVFGLFANWNDTSTGINLDKLPHPRLTKIRSGWLKPDSQAAFDGITAKAPPQFGQEVRLQGVGKSGKAWKVHIHAMDEVWRADLDGNGTQHYVFFSRGPYFNGRTTPVFRSRSC